MQPDVDTPKSWPLSLQGAFWSGTGPAAAIAGRWRAKLLGSGVEWLDPEARDYWGRLVQDPEVYPSVPEYPPSTGPGDDQFCGRCGSPASQADVFCRACGSRLR